VRTILAFGLRVYQRWISPLLPPACRYVPSCSEYALESVDRYGLLCGGGRALWRLMRCHPLARGGYDPVVRHEPAISAPDVPGVVSQR